MSSQKQSADSLLLSKRGSNPLLALLRRLKLFFADGFRLRKPIRFNHEPQILLHFGVMPPVHQRNLLCAGHLKSRCAGREDRALVARFDEPLRFRAGNEL